MQVKKFNPVLFVLLLAVAGYFIHGLLLSAMGNEDDAAFYHPLEKMYGFFALCSVFILVALIIIRQKSIDNVGQVFLLLTCIKMGIAYAFIYPVLEMDGDLAHFETMNFFLVFALFLTLETILTIRVLNKN